jgi:DNA-binding transcriptional regulator YhcF (GntR family)
LDASQSPPLYRQIAEALRYRISRGTLAAGARLPALRDAARAWGVNLHTVRRAYHELARGRLVEVRRPGGTYVAPRAGDAAQQAVDTFARAVIEEGRRRFGLDPRGVADLVAKAAAPPAAAVIHVAECSQTLARALARQVAERFGVDARPCLVDDVARTDAGPIVATYFHFNDVRARIPNRLGDVHFVTIEPALDRASTIARRAGRAGNPVTLCERDPLLAPAIAADVRRLLGGHTAVLVDARSNPSTLLKRRRGPVVFSPKSWELLKEAERLEPDAFLLEYRIPDEALEGLGAVLGRA